MDLIFLFLSFWIVFNRAGAVLDVGTINCKQNVETVNCPLNDTCSGTCRYSCADIARKTNDPERQIWGTQIYTYESSICKAATHDLRISTWNKTERKFILKRIPYDENYWASVRSDIHSYSYGKLPIPEKGSFVFLSPKVNERILDVASVHEPFLFSKAQGHNQTCFGGINIRSFNFTIFVPEANVKPTEISLENQVMDCRDGPRRNSETPTAGFQFTPERSMLSVVTSIAINPNADFYPETMTYTANINEDVTLVMKDHSASSTSCEYTWKKDGEELPDFVNKTAQQRTSLFLPNVVEGTQGFYSLECDTNFATRGLLRLIVRACPADRYGDNCSEQCPECKNNGVCHDITGVCICPPGYNGTTCENTCPSGYFGQTCSMSCPGRWDLGRNKPSCKGYLICLPDPYGCSCASGYKGIFCNESYPVLTENITLEDSTTNALSISFPEWDLTSGIGNGTPSIYRVFYKRNYTDSPWLSEDLPAAPSNENKRYRVTLKNLTSGTDYVLRVVILDVSGWSQEDGVEAHMFSTSCERPKEPPLNITVSADERKVFVSWELPSSDSWNCRTVESVVKYRSVDYYEEIWTNEESYFFNSKPFTEWRITICVGGRNHGINCAQTKLVSTKEDAPGPVTKFFENLVMPRNVYLRWNYPSEENGRIKYFVLRYEQTGWDHECTEPFDPSVGTVNVNPSVRTADAIALSKMVGNLNPSAWYKFELAAVTVKEGPTKTLTVATAIDVPSAKPLSFDFDISELSLKWSPPPCAQSNGKVDGYFVFVKYLRSPDQDQQNVTTQDLAFMPATKPLTKYNAKVFASTKAGIGKVYAEINFTTPETDKTAPTSLEITGRSQTSISITWKSPAARKGHLYSYEVSISQLQSGNSWSYKYIPQEYLVYQYRYTFSKLQPATAYIIRIQANTTIGLSPPLSRIARTLRQAPKEPKAPMFVQNTDTTITIKIFPVFPQDYTIKYYFVVISPNERQLSGEIEVRYTDDYEILYTPTSCKVITYGYRYEYIAGRLESALVGPEGTDFTVGTGRCRDQFYNQPLRTGAYYQVGIVAMSQYGEERSYSQVRYMNGKILVEKPKTDVYLPVLGVLIFLIVIVCIFIVIFSLPESYLRKARRTARQSCPMFLRRRRRAQADGLSFDNLNLEYDNDADCIDTESIGEDISHVIAVKDLENYINESLSNGEMKKEFKAIPKGQKYSCRIARLPANRLKNRYGNLLPYDHSRVKLKPTPGDPYSDYINANYVCGYKNAKRYIATQGPLPKTVNDFWKMIWAENSCKIFMITNLMELGRIKCDKYWPDETFEYGSITVTLKDSETVADFIIRTFEISSRKQKRELKQYHYRTWPDHGAPSYTAPIVRLLKKAKNYQPDSKTPIIVHCSAGVGRTGTLIVLDSMMDMGVAEDKVDVCGHTCEMRKKRTSLLENMEQYVFVYKALAQALCWGETSILCTDLVPQIGKLREPDPELYFTPLELQYQRLEKMRPHMENAAMRVARLPENTPKNRTPEILPPERARPILKTTSDEESTYINAVYVNGYRERDAFLVTQYPLPNTIRDFWQMMFETKSRTIVLLQDVDFTDPTCPQYWPSEGETVSYGHYQVECTSVKSVGDIHTWNLNLISSRSKLDAQESPIPIQLFHHLSWSVGQPLPQYPQIILELIDNVERAQRQGKHVITVQCLNGSTACGLFCATMFVCNKMINEQEVDAFMAVQNVRTNRPQFIECFEQYDFLCEIAVTFLDNFEAYANFQ